MASKRVGLDAFGFVGGGVKKLKGSSSTLSLSASSSAGSSPFLSATTATSTEGSNNFKIYCDLDGVLVDFVAGIRELFGGRGPDEITNQGQMWAAVSRHPSFYADLPWTEDGRELWDAIKHMNPNILTGVPRTKKSRLEKVAWCQRELGVETNHVDMAGKKSAHERLEGWMKEGVVNVITCWSKNKHHESRERAVLIDDRESIAEEWEKKGGIFIHHTKTATTIEQLRRHGILKSNGKPAPPVVEILD